MAKNAIQIDEARTRLAESKTRAALGVDFTLLRIDEVEQITGLRKSSIYKMARENRFPKPRKLTPNGSAVAWRSDELAKWLESRECA